MVGEGPGKGKVEPTEIRSHCFGVIDKIPIIDVVEILNGSVSRIQRCPQPKGTVFGYDVPS